jgi:hypothetical protein
MTTFNDLPEDLLMKIYDLCNLSIENIAEYMMNDIYINVNFWEKNDYLISNYLNNNKYLYVNMGSNEDIITKFRHWYIHHTNSPDKDDVIINTSDKKFILIRSKYNKQIFNIGDLCKTYNDPKNKCGLKYRFDKIFDFIVDIDYMGVRKKNSSKLSVKEFVEQNKNDNYFL